MKQRIFTVFLLSVFLIQPMVMAATKEITLKEKIGQMLMIGFKGTQLNSDDPIVKAILAQRIGGVILYDYDFQAKIYDQNIKNPEQLKHLTQQLQNYTRQSEKNNGDKSSYPLLIGIDYEGGKVNRLKESYGFPKTLSAAEIAQGSDKQAAYYAKQMAKTLKETGINLNFSPVVDVNLNPDNPIIGKLNRSFSSDPQKVIHYAALFSKAYQKQGILCVYKHFPGHGSSLGNTHTEFVDVTQVWKKSELTPYKVLLKRPYHCPMVMTAHVVNNRLDRKGYPASISAEITQKLLREKLHFNGVVITDDMQMKAIADHYGLAEAVKLAINAGADILVFANQLVPTPQDPKPLVEMIYQDVMAGKIQKSRINEAYERIIKLKRKMFVASQGSYNQQLYC